MAGLVALGGVIAGWFALARSTRDAAVVALVLGIVGTGLAGLHLATSSGGVGTGNGRAGAVVGLGLGTIAVLLARRALARSGRT